MKARRTLYVGLAAAIGICAWLALRPRTAAVERWSDASVWGGRLPRAGDNVVIPRGKRILLDTAPPSLGRLEVEGELLVADKGLRLRAETVLVSGRLALGTPDRRLTKPFLLELDASRIAQNPDAGMMAVIGMFQVYGREMARTWSVLDGSAVAGDRSIRTAEPLPASPGDRLVLAATGFNPDQCETVTVRSVEGKKVMVDAPLRFSHFGRIDSGVDERAEVGLLSRNVVIRGVGENELGGHIMLSVNSRTELDGVELSQMGQKGRLSRYPIHFHMAGDQSRSFVRNVSIHDCFNRALTIHGTQNLRVDSSVAYRSYGHLIFLEDGVETGNRLTNNLAMRAVAPPPGHRLLTSDASPACFWVTNPSNDLRANRAAGSDGEGFWLAFPKGPTGPSAHLAENRKVQPRRMPLGVFDGNGAHSNVGNGLFLDGQANPPGVYEAPSYVPTKGAVFERFLAYKNGKRGIWMRGAKLEVRHAVLADNPIGATFAASESVLRDSLVVGHTANGGGLLKPGLPKFPIRGFEFYDGLVGVSGVTFRNFEPNEFREAGALSALRFTPFFINPNNFVERARFENAKPVFFDHVPSVGTGARSADGYRTVCFQDRDGSVTGVAGSTVSIANPFLSVEDRTEPRSKWNAFVTRSRFGRLFVDFPKGDPLSRTTCTIAHLDRKGAKHRMGGNPYEGGATSFQTSVQPNENYRIAFDGPAKGSLRLALRYFQENDRIGLDLPAPKGPFVIRLNRKVDLTEGVKAEGSSYRIVKGRLVLDIVSNVPFPVVEILPGPRV